MYAICHDNSIFAAAINLCRGCYQRNLLRGCEALSGATLRGRAKSYSGNYRQSGRNLLRRLQRAGLDVREEIHAHGKRVLVIGRESVAMPLPVAA